MNKETRLEHYKTVLNVYETGNSSGGICEMLKRIRTEDHVDIEGDYPELYSLKPKDRGLDQYWFSNRQERIDALKKCIAMLEVEIKVGDTVEIITNNSGSRNKVGDVGIVVSIHSDGGVRVQVKDGPTRANWQKLSDLKKVEPSKIKVGDTVEITGIDTSYRHHKPDMEGMVGKSFKVLEIGSNDAKLDTNDLMEWFPLSVLEKVMINTNQISTSSDILSTNGGFKLGDTVEIVGNTSFSKNKVGDVGVITYLQWGW